MRSLPISSLRHLVPLSPCPLVIFLLGCSRPPAPSEKENPPAPVKVVAARMEALGEWTELLGTTQPVPGRAARVSTAVEGRVSVLGDGNGAGVAEGDRVRAGQVLARLDDRVARANRDKLVATLAELDEQKKQADYAVELAELEVRRLTELSRSSTPENPLVSRVELDKARIARKDTQSKQQGVAARQSATRAELRALDTQLDFYILKAPIAGRLGLFQVLPGQTLAVGTTVAEVVDLDELDVLCYVPPRSALRLEVGQPARVAGHKGPPGRVAFVAVQAQADTGNFAVKVRFPNRELGLRASAVLRVQALTQPEKKRLTIPEAALLEDQEPPAVVVAGEVTRAKDAEGKEEKRGKARQLRAVLGVRDRERHRVELLHLEDPETGKEVSPRDVLFVVEGAHGLQDGDPLRW